MKQQRKKKGPTIQDVADRAGVSVATVSRVLNKSGEVSPTVETQVQSALDAMNYKRMRKISVKNGENASGLIGLVVPDIENPYFSTLIKGIQDVAHSRGFNIILCDSNNDTDAGMSQIRQIEKNSIEALIYVHAGGETRETEELLGLDIPVVFLDRKLPLPGTNYVGSENRQGAYNAARYLLSLGHKDILYLSGNRELSTEKERYAGFTRALREEGVEEEQLKLLPCDYSFTKAFREVRRRLKERIDFTAVFAADDYMAFGALRALREAHLKVPEDISLIGFDDLPYSQMVSLTTVSQQAYQLGQNAMWLALDLRAGRKESPQEIILATSLIIRDSCRKN